MPAGRFAGVLLPRLLIGNAEPRGGGRPSTQMQEGGVIRGRSNEAPQT